MFILWAMLELGIVRGQMMQYEPNIPYLHLPLYALVSLEGQWDTVFMGARVRTDMVKTANDLSFYPTQMTFILEAGYRTRNFEIGFIHSCYHPLTPYLTTQLEWYQVVPRFEGAYNQVYARIQTSGSERGRKHGY